MESYNKPSDPARDDRSGFRSGSMHALIPGIILVGFGALFLLGNLGIIRPSNWFEYWPVILIAVGLVKLVDSTYLAGRILGAVLVGVGGIHLADTLGYIHFDVMDLWPLILIGLGLMMLWNRTHGGGGLWRRRPNRFRGWRMDPFGSSEPNSGNVVHEFAFFGGSKRTMTTPDFQGGSVSAVFGGINLDLTGAGMANNSAVLEVSSMFGGAEVRIPANWDAEVRGAGIFGGFTDNTIHPPASPEMKQLIVRGSAIFGGVVIKN